MFKGRWKLPVFMAIILVMISARAQADNLTLDEVYANVLAANPQVQSYKARLQAAEGNRIQQALNPNPEATFEIENFAGDGAREGFDAAEYTLGVAQQLEMSGKRSKREQVAVHDKARIRQEALAGIQAVLAHTQAAYMTLAIAQEKLALARKRVALANQTHETVKGRVSVAKSADIQHTKADIEVSAAEVEERKAIKDVDVAAMTLANLMGRATFAQSITADLSVLPEVPSQEALMEALSQTPLSVISEVAVAREKAALDLARANGVPDPTFGLGVRRYAEDDGSAFLASISFPIPIADRNQGAIIEAKANMLAAQSDRQAQRLALTRQAMALWQDLVSAREEALAYQDGLLPSAQRAYAQAKEGFDRGAFSFLDLLDAQRTLFDVQDNHLTALAAFYDAKAQVDMLSGAYAAPASSVFNSDK